MDSPGEILLSKITGAATLGFVPVAIHFELFETVAKLGTAVSASEVVEAVEKNENVNSTLKLKLAEDTLFIMAGLGLLDMLEEKYVANAVTKHMVTFPSSIHGALHFTLEALMASAFIYPKLTDTEFAYPFKENSTPFQYAYEKMGKTAFANQHLFAILHEQGRLESFNFFMEGKFGLQRKMSARVKEFGYNLDAVLLHQENPVVVDVGGGQGEWLLELKESYPHLSAENLILQEFNADAHPRAEVTAMDWDFKGATAQPIIGAHVYNLMHICHNMPDIETMQLLKKLSTAMEPRSRLFIQEFSKSLRNSNMHAGMIAWLGGRERSSAEWHAMAEIAGMKVTFEAHADKGEGLIEMMKA